MCIYIYNPVVIVVDMATEETPTINTILLQNLINLLGSIDNETIDVAANLPILQECYDIIVKIYYYNNINVMTDDEDYYMIITINDFNKKFIKNLLLSIINTIALNSNFFPNVTIMYQYIKILDLMEKNNHKFDYDYLSDPEIKYILEQYKNINDNYDAVATIIKLVKMLCVQIPFDMLTDIFGSRINDRLGFMTGS